MFCVGPSHFLVGKEREREEKENTVLWARVRMTELERDRETDRQTETETDRQTNRCEH